MSGYDTQRILAKIKAQAEEAKREKEQRVTVRISTANPAIVEQLGEFRREVGGRVVYQIPLDHWCARKTPLDDPIYPEVFAWRCTIGEMILDGYKIEYVHPVPVDLFDATGERCSHSVEPVPALQFKGPSKPRISLNVYTSEMTLPEELLRSDPELQQSLDHEREQYSRVMKPLNSYHARLMRESALALSATSMDKRTDNRLGRAGPKIADALASVDRSLDGAILEMGAAPGSFVLECAPTAEVDVIVHPAEPLSPPASDGVRNELCCDIHDSSRMEECLSTLSTEFEGGSCAYNIVVGDATEGEKRSDISSNKKWESISGPLLMKQMYYALRSTRKGGTIVLKFHGLQTVYSQLVMCIMATCSRVNVVKPQLSRPTNEEFYGVFVDFDPRSVPWPSVVQAVFRRPDQANLPDLTVPTARGLRVEMDGDDVVAYCKWLQYVSNHLLLRQTLWLRNTRFAFVNAMGKRKLPVIQGELYAKLNEYFCTQLQPQWGKLVAETPPDVMFAKTIGRRRAYVTQARTMGVDFQDLWATYWNVPPSHYWEGGMDTRKRGFQFHGRGRGHDNDLRANRRGIPRLASNAPK